MQAGRDAPAAFDEWFRSAFGETPEHAAAALPILTSLASGDISLKEARRAERQLRRQRRKDAKKAAAAAAASAAEGPGFDMRYVVPDDGRPTAAGALGGPAVASASSITLRLPTLLARPAPGAARVPLHKRLTASSLAASGESAAALPSLGDRDLHRQASGA